MVTTDFLYTGGDHLGPVFEGASFTEGPLLREALYEYPSTLDTCLGDGDPVLDPAAPRIAIGACPTGG